MRSTLFGFDRLDHPFIADLHQVERPLPSIHLQAAADAGHVACQAGAHSLGARFLDVGLTPVECDALFFELLERSGERPLIDAGPHLRGGAGVQRVERIAISRQRAVDGARVGLARAIHERCRRTRRRRC